MRWRIGIALLIGFLMLIGGAFLLMRGIRGMNSGAVLGTDQGDYEGMLAGGIIIMLLGLCSFGFSFYTFSKAQKIANLPPQT